MRRVFAQQSPLFNQDKKKTSQKLLFSRGFASFQLHLYSHVAWGTSLQPLSCLPAFPTSWFLFCILLPRPRRALFYTISNYAYLLGFSIAVQKRGNFSLKTKNNVLCSGVHIFLFLISVMDQTGSNLACSIVSERLLSINFVTNWCKHYQCCKRYGYLKERNRSYNPSREKIVFNLLDQSFLDNFLVNVGFAGKRFFIYLEFGPINNFALF